MSRNGEWTMERENVIFDVDSYKLSHGRWQYPPNTTSMFSYLESRGGIFDKTVFFGLQYVLKRYLEGSVVSLEDVEEASEFYAAHGVPFDNEGWMYIARDLKGRLPVRIRAFPEGSIVPTNFPLMTVESTDLKVFWIVSWLETMLLRVWYPINVATLGYHIKQDMKRWHERTSDAPIESLDFKLHDFGARGVSSRESAMIGGAAHLVNFKGSDTVVGVRCANRYYSHSMAGFSIPATEHSTITSWGRDGELAAYSNFLQQFAKPGAIIACVSDSYDLFNAVDELWGSELRQKVIDSGATLVVRPDSGSPPIIVTETLRRLDAKFGHTHNSKGYRVLNNVRVIQGDGVNHSSINEILDAIVMCGYSIDNIAFGMGGALLSGHTRDTQKFAYKCSSVTVDGKERDVFKDPITDVGKRSKSGRMDIFTIWGEHKVERLLNGAIELPTDFFGALSAMRTAFENGEVLVESTLDDVRSLVNASLI